MWLSIHAEPLPIDEGINDRIERRLGFALSRFGDRLGHVAVHLNDVNGLRGQVDKRCRVVVEVLGQSPVVLEDTDRSLTLVIDRVAVRVGLAVKRKFDQLLLYARLQGLRPEEWN